MCLYSTPNLLWEFKHADNQTTTGIYKVVYLYSCIVKDVIVNFLPYRKHD